MGCVKSTIVKPSSILYLLVLLWNKVLSGTRGDLQLPTGHSSQPTYTRLYFQSYIIIVISTTFTQGRYDNIPETNHVSKVYSVQAVLYLQNIYFMLFRKLNTFCTFSN
jgi:hypothetical protein